MTKPSMLPQVCYPNEDCTGRDIWDQWWTPDHFLHPSCPLNRWPWARRVSVQAPSPAWRWWISTSPCGRMRKQIWRGAQFPESELEWFIEPIYGYLWWFGGWLFIVLTCFNHINLHGIWNSGPSDLGKFENFTSNPLSWRLAAENWQEILCKTGRIRVKLVDLPGKPWVFLPPGKLT